MAGQFYDIKLPGKGGNRVHARGYYVNLYMTDFDVQLLYSAAYPNMPPSIASAISTTDKIYEIADLPGDEGAKFRKALASYREPKTGFSIGGMESLVVEDWVTKSNGYNSFLAPSADTDLGKVAYKEGDRFIQSKEASVPAGKMFKVDGSEDLELSTVGADLLTRLLGGRR